MWILSMCVCSVCSVYSINVCMYTCSHYTITYVLIESIVCMYVSTCMDCVACVIKTKIKHYLLQVRANRLYTTELILTHNQLTHIHTNICVHTSGDCKQHKYV